MVTFYHEEEISDEIKDMILEYIDLLRPSGPGTDDDPNVWMRVYGFHEHSKFYCAIYFLHGRAVSWKWMYITEPEDLNIKVLTIHRDYHLNEPRDLIIVHRPELIRDLITELIFG